MTSSNSTIADDYVDCPVCGGEGQIEIEVAVIDHLDGGYLAGKLVDCEFCDGNGEVDSLDAEEFLIHVELEDGNYLH